MKRIASKSIVAALATVTFLAACNEPEKAPPAQPAAQKAPEPEIPAEIQAAAEAALGAEVTILAHGDLSLSGQPQILAASLLKSTPTGVVPGTLFTRLTVLGKEGDRWKEILICTGHLQNQKGYLGGTPLVAINGWRLQKEMSKSQGLVMYFTPMRQPVTGTVKPIGVRWNAKTRRYQSLDYNYQDFLEEVKSLEKPETFLR